MSKHPVDGEDYTDEPRVVQIESQGMFAGFKRPCRNCGGYFRVLGDDGWCATCEREND